MGEAGGPERRSGRVMIQREIAARSATGRLKATHDGKADDAWARTRFRAVAIGSWIPV
jgi:hypothetical protein